MECMYGESAPDIKGRWKIVQNANCTNVQIAKFIFKNFSFAWKLECKSDGSNASFGDCHFCSFSGVASTLTASIPEAVAEATTRACAAKTWSNNRVKLSL